MSNSNTNNQVDTLFVKKLSEHATLPVRGSEFSAGFDLSASREATIPPGGRAIVHTDLSIACPAGTYARIAPRSGLAIKKGIDVGAGVVDADYRGEVGVILFNLDPTNTFEVKQGDRIAQLILEQICMAPIQEVLTELDVTVRGSGGFGSTGVEKKATSNTTTTADNAAATTTDDAEDNNKKPRTD